jgi:hypothetical protein
VVVTGFQEIESDASFAGLDKGFDRYAGNEHHLTRPCGVFAGDVDA